MSDLAPLGKLPGGALRSGLWQRGLRQPMEAAPNRGGDPCRKNRPIRGPLRAICIASTGTTAVSGRSTSPSPPMRMHEIASAYRCPHVFRERGAVPYRPDTLIRTIATLGLGVGATLTGGCFRYTLVDSPSPPLGTEVRLELTDAGAVSLAPLVGNRVELVDGRVVSVADTGLTMAVTATTDRTGIETGWRGERVVFPRSALGGVHRRTLDRKRSYMVGGIAAGLVAAVGIGFNVTGGGSATNGGSTTSPK